MKSFRTIGLSVVIAMCFTFNLQAQNVIIVVVDGARYSETFGAGNTYIPHLYDDLRPLGTLYTNFYIKYPESKTETCSGHSTVESGTWQNIDEEGNERPTRPTIFEYLRKEDGNPRSDCYVVSGKDKLDILTHSSHSDYGSDYRGTWVGDDDRDDGQTFSNVISVMQNYQPKILVINFAEVDYDGHYNGWDDYIEALEDVDNYIYQLWQHIENGDWGYTTQNTTLFITNDHGRHDDQHGGFDDHGDGCDGCVHIMLLALGRGIDPHQTVSDTAWHVDIAPTVGVLMDFETPLAIGNSLIETPTFVSNETNSEPLSEYNLGQNFPNPFNPSTKIKFTIPEKGYVQLKVYNLLGEKVATLFDGEADAGINNVDFNAIGLSSGIYIYTLTTNDFFETKKMILTK